MSCAFSIQSGNFANLLRIGAFFTVAILINPTRLSFRSLSVTRFGAGDIPSIDSILVCQLLVLQSKNIGIIDIGLVAAVVVLSALRKIENVIGIIVLHAKSFLVLLGAGNLWTLSLQIFLPVPPSIADNGIAVSHFTLIHGRKVPFFLPESAILLSPHHLPILALFKGLLHCFFHRLKVLF